MLENTHIVQSSCLYIKLVEIIQNICGIFLNMKHRIINVLLKFKFNVKLKFKKNS